MAPKPAAVRRVTSAAGSPPAKRASKRGLARVVLGSSITGSTPSCPTCAIAAWAAEAAAEGTFVSALNGFSFLVFPGPAPWACPPLGPMAGRDLRAAAGHLRPKVRPTSRPWPMCLGRRAQPDGDLLYLAIGAQGVQ